MDIRIEKNPDGTLSGYEAFPFSGMYVFVMRGDREAILYRFDVTGSIRRWLDQEYRHIHEVRQRRVRSRQYSRNTGH